MSSLSNFGFNVRRKRCQDLPSFPSAKDGKALCTLEPSSSLAFATTPPLLKPTPPTSSVKRSSAPLRKHRRPQPRDPKQSTLLPFFATQSNPSSPQRLLQETKASVYTRSQQHSPPTQYTDSDEENEICVVRRHFTAFDLLPILFEAFSGYSSGDLIYTDESLLQPRAIDKDTLLPLKGLQIRGPEIMDFSLHTTRRRRRTDNDDEQTVANLHTAFATSVSLSPVKKRLCKTYSDHHCRLSDSLSALEDEFDQGDGEAKEIRRVRQYLTTDQVNTLLLDIANEMFAFDNNTWCASYIGR